MGFKLPLTELTILIALCYATNSIAAEKQLDITDIASFTLEDLLNIKVSSVSKINEDLDKAPGIVTVITSSQIKELGARNLTDVLVTIPGMFAFDNYFSLTDQFSIRGNLSEDYNTKILFLINGHPSYHTLNGTFFSDMIPIESIERVEVVRGPVSVLYGTNALTGVINIITKQAFEGSDNYASVQTGNHATSIAKINSIHRWQQGFIMLAAEIKNTDGFNQLITAEQDDPFISFKQDFTQIYAGDGGVIELGEEHRSLFSQLKHNNLEVDFSYFAQERAQKQGILPSLYFRGKPFDINMLAVDARYNLEISDNFKWRLIGRFDDYQYNYTVGNYQELDVGLATDGAREAKGDWRGKKMGGEIIADWNYSNWNLIAGILYDQYKGKRVSFETGETSAYWFAPEITGINANFELIPTDSDNNDSAIYANGRYNFSDKLEGIAGFRYTKNKSSGGHSDHRIGAIYSLSDSNIFKALWGTSYRSANLNEYNVSATPVVVGNPNLDFETLKGLDLAFIHNADNYSFTVNYYQNETDNEIATRLIQDDSVGFPVPTYTNVQGKKTQGVEFDMTYLFSSRLKLYWRWSKVFSIKDLETGNNISKDSITEMMTTTIAWQTSDKFSLNLSSLYNGNWQNEGTYNIFSFSSTYQVNTQLNLFADIYNLTDKEFSYAIWQGNGESTRLPAGKPRSISIGLQYSW